jgi:biotin synthase-related radical SAM superfamily protein
MRDDPNGIPAVTVKKAELIHFGEIYVPDSIKLPYPLSSSTAGPGAGKKALALAFGGTRLKLRVCKDRGARFSLVKANDDFQIIKGQEIFIEEVEIIPTLLHAPNQAFVNLHDGCIYSCEFCAVPILQDEYRKKRNPEQAVKMILEAAQGDDFKSVAITSGVVDSPEETVNEIIEVVEKVRENLPEVEIGVESYVLEPEDIDRLHKAGATEIKINIESFDRGIFEKICPDLNYEHILGMLEHAVDVFGRGKVATNILIGLGESDEKVLEGVEHFARMGIVANIRVLRINDYNYERMVKALGHDLQKVEPERMIKFAAGQKDILNKHNLTTHSFETMCHKCGCCDIVPFWDV